MVAGRAVTIVSFIPDVVENAGEVWQGMVDGARGGGVGRVWCSDGARDAGVG